MNSPLRWEASVARMERSAIRVIVSGAGKSRISLRFMRATDLGFQRHPKDAGSRDFVRHTAPIHE
jgi:hypothetical protein